LQDTLLRTSPLLATLGDQGRALVRRGRALRLSADQEVITEGSSTPGFYFVLIGQLEVTRRPQHYADPVLLGQLTDCDFFGEMALLSQQPASATVRTSTFAQLLQIDSSEIARCTESSPDFLKVLQAEAKRRDRGNRAILRGAARFDAQKGTVVFLKKDES
jgi:CRP-like cAMP-binding protein